MVWKSIWFGECGEGEYPWQEEVKESGELDDGELWARLSPSEEGEDGSLCLVGCGSDSGSGL